MESELEDVLRQGALAIVQEAICSYDEGVKRFGDGNEVRTKLGVDVASVVLAVLPRQVVRMDFGGEPKLTISRGKETVDQIPITDRRTVTIDDLRAAITNLSSKKS